MKIEKKELVNKIDDSKDPITIDYYDRINHKWIKVETTKEVARVLHAEDEKTRRGNNRYNKYNYGFDDYFDQSKKSFSEREKYLIDDSAEIDLDKADEELMKLKQDEHQRTLIENSLCCLTPEQREVVEMAFYQNMSYSEIGKKLNIDKTSVYARMKNAQKNIKNYIKNSEI